MIRNPRLQQLADLVEAGRAQARRVAGGLSKAQLDWQPAPGRWGVGQCIEHLIVSNERLALPIRGRLSEARAKGANAQCFGEWRPSFIGGLLIRAIDPATGKRRLKTGRVFMPGPAARPEVLAAFERNLDEVLDLLLQTDGLDPSTMRIVSPMSWFIRYHVGDALTMMAVHLPRHLDQAERVKGEPGFPAS